MEPTQQRYFVVCMPDGQINIVPYDDSRTFNDQVQALVGGTYDRTRLGEDITGLVHDEGLLIGLPPNRRLHQLAGPVVLVEDYEHEVKDGESSYMEGDWRGFDNDSVHSLVYAMLLSFPIMTEEAARASLPAEEDWIKVTAMNGEEL